MSAPTLVPARQSIGIPSSSKTRRTPIWATPRAKPPPSASPMRGRSPAPPYAKERRPRTAEPSHFLVVGIVISALFDSVTQTGDAWICRWPGHTCFVTSGIASDGKNEKTHRKSRGPWRRNYGFAHRGASRECWNFVLPARYRPARIDSRGTSEGPDTRTACGAKSHSSRWIGSGEEGSSCSFFHARNRPPYHHWKFRRQSGLVRRSGLDYRSRRRESRDQTESSRARRATSQARDDCNHEYIRFADSSRGGRTFG